MYSNIPINDTIKIIEKTLINNKETKKYIQQIKNTISIITNQNYFTHNNSLYKMNDGLTMGSPISAILSEIFLQNLDDKIQLIIKKYDNNSTWLRYVDDALCIIQTPTTYSKKSTNSTII